MGTRSQRQARHSLGVSESYIAARSQRLDPFSHEARTSLCCVRQGNRDFKGAARQGSGGRCDGPRRAYVSQQSGVARGLGALFPGPAEQRATSPDATGVDASSGVKRMNALGEDFASSVATSESGIALDLQGARRARRAVRARRRRGRHRRSRASASRCSAPGGARSAPTTRSCSSRRPASTRGPRSTTTRFDRSMMLTLCVLALRLDVLRYDAWHDPLTGLYDRRSFDRLLEMAIARSTRYGWPFTLVLLDLDHFKNINDEHGHQAGDAALRDLGERFRRALRFGDNAGRIGGDEFAMILPNTEADLVPALLDRVRRAEGVETRVPGVLVRRRAVPARSDGVRQARAARRHPALRGEAGEAMTPGDAQRRGLVDRRPRARAAQAARRARRRFRGPRRHAARAAARRRHAPNASTAPTATTNRCPCRRRASRPGTPTARSRSRSCAGAPRRPRPRPRRPRARTRRRATRGADAPTSCRDAAGRRRRADRADRCRTAPGCSRCSRSPTPTSSRCISSSTASARSAARRRAAGSTARSRPRSTRSASSAPASSPASAVGARARRRRSDGDQVVVAVALDGVDARSPLHYGLAAGTSLIDAAARATLDALNRRLSRGADRPPIVGAARPLPSDALALVAQGIEHRPPEACAQVRILPRARS